MRVLITLLALVTTPFLASVSQSTQGQINGRGHDAQHCAMRAALHPDRSINKCDPPPPPPPPSPPPASTCQVFSTPTGNGAVMGTVYHDVVWTFFPGMCLELSLGGQVVARTLSADPSGKYVFTGLALGDYTICEVVPSGSTQTFPTTPAACPNGIGQTTFLPAGAVYAFFDFANIP